MKIKGEVSSASRERLTRIAKESKESIIKFSDYFFPHHKIDPTGKTIPPAKIHYEFEELLRGAVGYGRNKGWYNLLAILPRGTAKSTYATVFFALWCAIFTNKRYIILVGATSESISDHFETLKEEVKSNHLLKLFNIKPDPDGKDNSSHFDLIGPPIDGVRYLTGQKTIRISAYSASSFPRGKKRGAQRPDLIIIDDLEKKKKGTQSGVESKAYRDDIMDLFRASIVPSGFNSETMQIVMLGTIMHEAQLLNQLYQQSQAGTCSPVFKAIKYSMIENYGTPEAYSIWDEKMSIEQFNQMLESARHEGTENIVYNEYLSLPTSPDDEIFCKSDFKYFILRAGMIYESNVDGEVLEDVKPIPLKDTSVVITADLAFTVDERSDFTAFAICAVDIDENVYILDVKAGKWETYDLIDVAKDLIAEYKPVAFGLEDAAGGKVMIDIVTKELEGVRNFTGVTPLQTGGMKKEDRVINYLQQPYKAGRMHHRASNGQDRSKCEYVDELEHQILSVTKLGITCKHDDYVDAVSYVYQLTDIGAIYNEGSEYDDYDNPGNNYIID